MLRHASILNLPPLPSRYFTTLPQQTLDASSRTLADLQSQIEHTASRLAQAQAAEKDASVTALHRSHAEALRQLQADRAQQ